MKDVFVLPQRQGICVVYSLLESLSLFNNNSVLSFEKDFINVYIGDCLINIDQLNQIGLESVILLTTVIIKLDPSIKVQYPDFSDVNFKFLVDHFIKILNPSKPNIIEYKDSINPFNEEDSTTILLKNSLKKNLACVSIHNDDPNTLNIWKCHCFIVAFNGTEMIVIDPNFANPYPFADLSTKYGKFHFGDGIYLEA